MNLRSAFIIFLVLSFLAVHAVATTVPFDTSTEVFQLGDGGGGFAATLNGQSVETFCVDFANQLWYPYDYQANLTPIQSTSDLSNTRFGAVTSWSDPWSNSASFATTLDAAGALGRYQMAAFLLMEYQMPNTPTVDASNEGIQQAIWDLLDPTGAATLPNIGDATAGLGMAATWYSSTTSGQKDALLANFDIVSGPGMYTCPGGSGALCGGFQEQIVDPLGLPQVPEPRGQVLMMMGLLAVCWVARGRVWKRS